MDEGVYTVYDCTPYKYMEHINQHRHFFPYPSQSVLPEFPRMLHPKDEQAGYLRKRGNVHAKVTSHEHAFQETGGC